MSASPAQPNLRLVGAENPATLAVWRRGSRASADIAAENRTAAQPGRLDPTDPRWVLAVRTQTQLQGSALSPERRRRMLRTAEALGVRPFDANMVIAIVQDHARRGAMLSEAVPILSLVREPEGKAPRRVDWLRWAAAILTALIANAFLVWWLLGAR